MYLFNDFITKYLHPWGGALGVDGQQKLDSADVKVTLPDTSVTARPDDG